SPARPPRSRPPPRTAVRARPARLRRTGAAAPRGGTTARTRPPPWRRPRRPAAWRSRPGTPGRRRRAPGPGTPPASHGSGPGARPAERRAPGARSRPGASPRPASRPASGTGRAARRPASSAGPPRPASGLRSSHTSSLSSWESPRRRRRLLRDLVLVIVSGEYGERYRQTGRRSLRFHADRAGRAVDRDELPGLDLAGGVADADDGRYPVLAGDGRAVRHRRTGLGDQ